MKENTNAELEFLKWKLGIYQDTYAKYKAYLETCDDSVEHSLLKSINELKSKINNTETLIIEKMPISDYWQEQIDDILNYFDFETIFNVSVFLTGKSRETKLDSIESLKSTAKTLMTNIVRLYERNPEKCYHGNLDSFTSDIEYSSETKKFYITLHYQLL